ncbi:hypothetical protein NQ315_014364, partial [Exocentrus adspersus]
GLSVSVSVTVLDLVIIRRFDRHSPAVFKGVLKRTVGCQFHFGFGLCKCQMSTSTSSLSFFLLCLPRIQTRDLQDPAPTTRSDALMAEAGGYRFIYTIRAGVVRRSDAPGCTRCIPPLEGEE